MEDKILNRIGELSEQIESILKERDNRINELRGMEIRIKELSAAIIELKGLLDTDKES